MKKSARTLAPESSRSQWLERLTDAMNHLAQELRVVRDVMDEIREDLGWITRNGIPGRHGEHTQIVRMARDPLSPDANERLTTQKISPDDAPSSFDELVAEIAEAVTVVGQEHVNLLLTALDDARASLLAAIKTPSAEPKPTTAVATEQSAPAVKPPKASKPGQLF